MRSVSWHNPASIQVRRVLFSQNSICQPQTNIGDENCTDGLEQGCGKIHVISNRVTAVLCKVAYFPMGGVYLLMPQFTHLYVEELKLAGLGRGLCIGTVVGCGRLSTRFGGLKEDCIKNMWGKQIGVKPLWVYSRQSPLTLNVRGPSYFSLTRSISWLLMPWLLASPGYQQPWYWLCRIGRSLPYLRRNFNYLCH